MEGISVRFRFKGKEYIGKLTNVMGTGNTATYHLYVNAFYWGRLRFNELYGQWIFDPTPKTEGLEVLAAWMGHKVDPR